MERWAAGKSSFYSAQSSETILSRACGCDGTAPAKRLKSAWRTPFDIHRPRSKGTAAPKAANGAMIGMMSISWNLGQIITLYSVGSGGRSRCGIQMAATHVTIDLVHSLHKIFSVALPGK